MRIEIGFNGPAYEGRSRFVDAEQCINFYLEQDPRGGEGKFILYRTPGLEAFADVGTGKPIRGTIQASDFIFAVSNNQLFRISAAGVATEIGAGTILTSTGQVSMATNGLDVAFVDGRTGYVYDISAGTLAQITDADFPSEGADFIVIINGFYYINRAGTNQIFESAFNDGSSWTGNFDSAGSKPDIIASLIVDRKNLIILGEASMEAWYPAAGGSINLIPNVGAFKDQGSVAPSSVAEINNAAYWLGRNKHGQGQVIQALGLQPRAISTPAIEFQIAQYSDISDAVGLTYQRLGHAFYALSFNEGDTTWVYDSGVGQWHERSSRITDGAGLTRDGRWRIDHHVLFNGDNIVSDGFTDKLYKLKETVFDEDGTTMILTRTAPVLRKNQDRITIHELQILLEPGTGLVSGQGSDPQILLSWSIDGGFTFGNAINVPIGQIGEYANRAITGPLGQGRNWVFRMSISDPVKATIIGAFADAIQDID